jgi:hypothetical protein
MGGELLTGSSKEDNATVPLQPGLKKSVGNFFFLDAEFRSSGVI